MVQLAPQFSHVLLLLNEIPAATVCCQKIPRMWCCFQIGMSLQRFAKVVPTFLTRTTTTLGVRLIVARAFEELLWTLPFSACQRTGTSRHCLPAQAPVDTGTCQCCLSTQVPVNTGTC
jgi:hypothetical protein